MHLFLSPHVDDAIFSCGAQIAHLIRMGEPILLVTIMAGDPPEGFQPTAFTEELRARWNLGDHPTAARRVEDAAAASALGYTVGFGSIPDAIYRIDPHTNEPLYPNVEAIFGPPHDHDPVHPVEKLIALLPVLGVRDILHVPLGVGHHVDHLLIRDLGLVLAKRYPHNKVYFYEEFPYSRGESSAIRAALQTFGQPLIRVSRSADDEAIQAKIKAVACYTSQISSFWDSLDAMAADVHSFMAEHGEGEWRLLRGEDLE